MKPQTIVLIVLGCAVAVGVQAACALLILGGMTLFDSGPPLAVNPLPAPGRFPVAAPLPPAPRGEPCTKEALGGLRGTVVPVRDCTFSGPYSQANLTLFLIHGRDTLTEQRVLPLQTALDRGLAMVHEGILTVDNRADVPLFIQGGDIIKGGIQDRVLPYDQLVPPGTNQGPMFVFCVEAGRSGPRGQELSTSFQSATEQLPGKRLHLAARQQRSQAGVWEGVRQVQLALARNVGGSVQAPQSQTSLQLTLENGLVHQAMETYLDDLAQLPSRHKDVIGVAVAINGQIQSADLYASSALFRELYPKLLKASAVAALAERQRGAAPTGPSADALQQFLSEAEAGQVCQQERHNSTLVLRQESAQGLLFDTCDPAQQNLVVHRSFLAK